jgi:hypothetical protein
VRPVVFLEFNELSPRLMTRFMAEGKLPNFARLHRESEAYVTEAKEEPPALEPWIQWVNVHSGLPYSDHGIFNLDEGHKLRRLNVWDILSGAGYRVLLCGSMNVRYELPFHGVVIPDPWTTAVPPHPASLAPYFRFVQKNVLEYTNDKVPLSAADYASFLSFMLSHGLSAHTVKAILRQLVGERGGRHRWKRATILDKLQFDLFAHYYRERKPDFSTFFANSTAHFQHLYWRHLEPDGFAAKPSPAEQEEYGAAILFGYQEMDGLVGRFYDLCGDEATLVLCTALSQQPCLAYEESGGKVWYRPRDFDKLLDFAGVPQARRVAPVMAEEFHVYLDTPDDLADTEERLSALRVEGRPAMRLRPHDGGLMAGCGIFDHLPQNAVLERPDTGAKVPFFDLLYRVEGVKSGMHHPDGILWVRRPERRFHESAGKVPLEAIAPTVLSWFGLPAPAYMKAPPLAAGAPVEA